MEMVQEQKRKISIAAFIMIVMIYVSPNILFLPMGLVTELFTLREAKIIISSPLFLLFTLILIGFGSLMATNLNKTVASFDKPDRSLSKINKRLKILATLNIVFPLLSSLVTATIVLHVLTTHKIQLESFMGESPVVGVAIFAISLVFEFALLFYVIHIRLTEGYMHFIPFGKNQITMDLFQRNILTLVCIAWCYWIYLFNASSTKINF